VRWTALFADLEGQLEAAERADLAAEVTDRSRREAGLVGARDRLAAAVGAAVTVHLGPAGLVTGRLTDAGPDWLLLEEGAGREVLVPYAAVLSVGGLTARTQAPDTAGQVAAALDLRWALRGLARSRAAVAVLLRDGSVVPGTLDRVGADHVELAEHAAGEPRRARAVAAVRLVPLTALAALRQL
jgi:hypothetical protein